MEITPAIGEHT